MLHISIGVLSKRCLKRCAVCLHVKHHYTIVMISQELTRSIVARINRLIDKKDYCDRTENCTVIFPCSFVTIVQQFLRNRGLVTADAFCAI